MDRAWAVAVRHHVQREFRHRLQRLRAVDKPECILTYDFFFFFFLRISTISRSQHFLSQLYLSPYTRGVTRRVVDRRYWAPVRIGC